MPPRVLILDAEQRSALATVRSLGSRGLRIITADVNAGTLSGASRFSASSLRYPDPASAPAAFVDAIQNTIKMNDITVVMPMTDLTTMALIQHRERLAPAKLACASADSYDELTDKMKLMQIASELGIPVPSTQVAKSAQEVMHLSHEHPFPLVLKPGRSRYVSGGRIYATRVRIASSDEELKAILRESSWLDHNIPCLLQHYIPGHGAGVFALSNGSRVVAWFAHRRIREKPPTGGVSVLSESVSVDKTMQHYAQLLLACAKWTGPAMVEFRVGSDAVPYLMEVNGRFWGSLELAIDSGVDFPWLWYQLLTGDSALIEENLSYRTGRRLRWLLGDLDNLLIQLKTEGLSRSRKTRALKDFLRSFVDSSCKEEVFRWSDPAPALRELSTWIRTLG